MRYIINTTQENNKYFENRKRKWEIKWPYYSQERDAKDGYINRYILGGDAEEIHAQLEFLISEPDVKYETWLVNSGLSYKSLENEIKKKKIKKKRSLKLFGYYNQPKIIFHKQTRQ